LLNFAELAERDFVRETRQMVALRNQVPESCARGAGRNKEHATREEDDSQCRGDRECAEPPVKFGESPAYDVIGSLGRAANLRTRECGYAEEQKENQEHEEAQAIREQGRRQQFQEGDGFDEEVVAVGLRRQYSHHSEEKNHVD